ncbi:hypothetical protein BH23CHL2_BH23CHL2_07820 [soil metagenome]
MSGMVQQALENDRVIDITTIGRKSGNPTRKEIWFHNIDGKIYITGTPGRRDWYANLAENPKFTFHLKETVEADLNGTARPITDEDEKRRVLAKILANLDRSAEIDQWASDSPLVKVDIQTT